MKTDIWMPVYIGDYMADTMHLTTEQHGAYLLLLMAYWMHGGPLPERQIPDICKMNGPDKDFNMEVLSGFFSINKGVWTHKRVEIELRKARERCLSASKKGKKGAVVRWGYREKGSRGRAMARP